MPTYTQENRPVRIQTPFGENVLLIKSLNGRESLGRGFHYELELLSEEHELDYKKIIGQNVTILVDKSNKEPRYFNGFVSRFAQTKYERKLAVYRATIVPWLWFLTRSSDCRIFQKMTIPDILKQVFQDFGFTDVIDRLNGEYRQWDYCVQYRETAFDFVSRLMEEEGIYHYFKHEAGKHSLVLCDSPASHKQFAGYEQLLYRQSSVLDEETLRTWEVQFEVESGAYAARDFDFTAPKRNTTATSFRDRSHGQSQLEQFDYLGEQPAFTEGERYTKLRLEELQSQHETYTGEGGARGVCTGVRFVMKGHPRASFNTEYLTTGVEYCIQANPFETTEAQGEEFKFVAKVSAILLDEQFRPPRVTPKPIVHGPQSATVVGPTGQKIYTDSYGRVKVQFHWDRLGKNDENSSCWMRVSQSWAGKPKTVNWGDMAIPHIGDEVIVECLEGDPDRPLITGRVYNQANMPPLDLPANQHKRIWQDDYGNRLVFDATPGDEHIRLHSPHHNSGITLGRSLCNFTENNVDTCNLGNTSSVQIGTNCNVFVGAYCMPVLGINVVPVVGASLAINWAATAAVGYGPQFTMQGGQTYKVLAGDQTTDCGGNTFMTSKKMLNIVTGGEKATDGEAILHALKDSMELTVGKAPTPTTNKKAELAIKLADGLMFIVPVLSAVVAGAATTWVQDTNSSAPSDDVSQDHQNNQIAMESVAGATVVLGLLAGLAVQMAAQKRLGPRQPQKHAAQQYAARLTLTNTTPAPSAPATPAATGAAAPAAPAATPLTGTAILEAKTKVDLKATDHALVKLDATEISIRHDAGKVLISAGTSGIMIENNGVVTVCGPDVKFTGNFTVNNGALTVTGAALPLISTLQADVAALQKDNLTAQEVFQSMITTLVKKNVATFSELI